MVENTKTITLVMTDQQHAWLVKVKMMMGVDVGRPVRWEEATMLAFSAWRKEHQWQKEPEAQVNQSE